MKPAFLPGQSNSVRFRGGTEAPYYELPLVVEIDNSKQGMEIMSMESTWDLTPEERIAVAEGAMVEVTLYGISAAHPPIRVEVSKRVRELPLPPT